MADPDYHARVRAYENERRKRRERPPCLQCGADIAHRHYTASLCENCAELNRLDGMRSSNFKAQYGMEWETRLEMQAAQGNLCWACGDALKPHGKTRLAGEPALGVVDHCHDTGKVRGILCAPCNSVEGHIKNGRVQMLERYLKSQRRQQYADSFSDQDV